jgi:hypothetical protein
MAINVLIGVGGTGAKIVESALYLLSAGVGPRSPVVVGLVDQDNSNGNVVRTEHLLGLLGRLKGDFNGSANAIDWKAGEAEGGTSLFSIEVEPLFGDGGSAHWRPAPDNMPTLRHVMQHQEMPEDEKALFNLLFRDETASPADAEQTMNLAEGYRGRAHVGAAALVSAIDHDQPEFINRLIELMRTSSGGEEVRIFMAGSLFGGTGAAGFPTIARMLHKLRAPNNSKRIKGDKVHIGGALMLPYFQFGDPGNEAANVITTAQLLPQARVAVEFYQTLLQQEDVFDRLYVSGWDKMFALNYHEPGRAEQRNPPLLPELVAALGAMDFFTLPAADLPADQPLIAARRESEAFGWSDLPASGELKKGLYDRLGGTLRFALWWLYRVEPAVDDRTLFGGIRTGWLKKLAGDTDWQVDTPDARKNLKQYCELMLLWASSMHLFSNKRLSDFALWDSGRIRKRANENEPPNPVDLHASRSEDESLYDLNAILCPSDENSPPVDAKRVFNDLHERILTGNSRGFGRLVAAVHRASRPFRKEV